MKGKRRRSGGRFFFAVGDVGTLVPLNEGKKN